MNMREQLVAAYLDFRNNYLTIALWAEHHGLTEEQGRALYLLAKEVAESEHPEA